MSTIAIFERIEILQMVLLNPIEQAVFIQAQNFRVWCSP